MMDVIKHITGITSDTREVKNGYLFAALKGLKHDGVDFIPEAVANGATYILAPRWTEVHGATLIESDNPRLDFAKLCATYYNAQPDMICAVTGTNGKTSTADFIRQILEHAGEKSASLGTIGLVSKHFTADNVMTTPPPAQLYKLLSDLKHADINFLAMEASSHGLDQYRLHGVKVNVAGFTNLTQDHLDYHHTMDDYFVAKEKLFTEILTDDGVAVVNIDDAWGAKIHHANRITYGQNENANIHLISQTPTHDGQDILFTYGGEQYHIDLPLIGLFQVYNVLCAVGCCLGMGLDIQTIINALPFLKNVAGRVQQAFNVDDKTAYIDYAHTPDALEKVLIALRPHVRNRLIVVFGAGGDRDKGKRPIMGAIAEKYADIVIVTDDNPRTENPDQIRDDILSACSKADNIGDRREAIAKGVATLKAGDVLLVAGKGHEQGQTIGTTTHPFDDVTETKKAMEALK